MNSVTEIVWKDIQQNEELEAIIEKTIKNFFIDNYKEEIKDGELTCTDLIYYSKDLKKK